MPRKIISGNRCSNFEFFFCIRRIYCNHYWFIGIHELVILCFMTKYQQWILCTKFYAICTDFLILFVFLLNGFFFKLIAYFYVRWMLSCWNFRKTCAVFSNKWNSFTVIWINIDLAYKSNRGNDDFHSMVKFLNFYVLPVTFTRVVINFSAYNVQVFARSIFYFYNFLWSHFL